MKNSLGIPVRSVEKEGSFRKVPSPDWDLHKNERTEREKRKVRLAAARAEAKKETGEHGIEAARLPAGQHRDVNRLLARREKRENRPACPRRTRCRNRLLKYIRELKRGKTWFL